jgi:allophanate hydrolase subunit 1
METENNNLLTIMNNDEIKKLKNKEYLKKFVEKNKESIKDKIECPICYSTYSYFNKSKHCKTKRHIKLLSVKSNNKITLSI